MAITYIANVHVSSMARRFNLSVHADVHWIEGDILSVSTAASNGENLFRKYSSKQYGSSIQSVCTIVSGGSMSTSVCRWRQKRKSFLKALL